MFEHFSHIHCGPRDAVKALFNQALTVFSSAPSPFSIAAIKASDLTVGLVDVKSFIARLAAGKSSSPIANSARSNFVS